MMEGGPLVRKKIEYCLRSFRIRLDKEVFPEPSTPSKIMSMKFFLPEYCLLSKLGIYCRVVHYIRRESQLEIQNSSVGYGDDDYTLLDEEFFPYYTLAQAADLLGIRKQRMSRLLRILQVPIHKIGTLVLLNQSAVDRIKEAITQKEVKRGRKPDAT